jgi:branched-chain amino acid transport system substrate-binding protein
MAILRVTLTAALLLALAALPAAAQETIKTGFFAPLTGPAAFDGASTKHSAEIAVEELNAAGGIKGKKVALVVYDDRLNSSEAVAVANKLVQRDQVAGVISGSYAGPSRVTTPI